MTETIDSKLWECTVCTKQLPVIDIFVLRHVGPVWSLKPMCESCADKKLAELGEKA